MEKLSRKDIRLLNEVGAKRMVQHFSERGIGVVCFIGLNIDNDSEGAFTFLAPGHDTSKIREMLKDIMAELEHGESELFVGEK